VDALTPVLGVDDDDGATFSLLQNLREILQAQY
jgi:hypothetical protein